MTDPIIIGAILLGASFVQGFTGFGFGLVVAPTLVLFYPVSFVVPFTVLVAIIINLILLARTHRDIDWRSVRPLAGGAFFGVPLGVFFFLTVDETLLKAFLSILLLSFSSYSLLVKDIKKPLGAPSAFGAGLLSGWLGGALSTGGPPAIIWVTLQPWDKRKAKATLNMFLTIGAVAITAGYALTGVITEEIVRTFVFTAPLVFIGTLAGSLFFDRVDQPFYRKMVFVLLLFMGGMIFPFNG